MEDEGLNNYTCVRCGYQYQKKQDWEPFLCHRCMRYISKKVWNIMQQITPPTSTPATDKAV